MSNLTVRLISAAALALIGFSALTLNVYSRWAFMAAVLSLGAWEFSRMIGTKLSGPSLAWFPAVLVILFSLSYLPDFGLLPAASWNWALMIISVLSFTVLGFRYVDIATMAPWIYLHIFCCAYFGIYTAAVFGLLNPSSGWSGIYPLLMVELSIITADAGAYFTGRSIGKRKLAPSISGGKTIEGAVGGAVLTLILAVFLGPRLLGISVVASLGLGALMAGTAIIGDLFISILKRYTGTKDSSQLIPGHGGILDRFDSLLFSAPVAVFYLQLIRH